VNIRAGPGPAVQPNGKRRRLRIRASLDEPEEGVDGVVLLIWGEGEGRKVDIARVLLLCAECSDASTRPGSLVGDGDVRVDGRVEDGIVGDGRCELLGDRAAGEGDCRS
jgi:hypothetical protein